MLFTLKSYEDIWQSIPVFVIVLLLSLLVIDRTYISGYGKNNDKVLSEEEILDEDKIKEENVYMKGDEDHNDKAEGSETNNSMTTLKVTSNQNINNNSQRFEESEGNKEAGSEVTKTNNHDDNDISANNENSKNNDDQDENILSDNNTWRCACESGFLPPGLLKSFGGMEAMMRMGTGQCYHKP